LRLLGLFLLISKREDDVIAVVFALCMDMSTFRFAKISLLGVRFIVPLLSSFRLP